MKKLQLLFVCATTALFSACSKDDNHDQVIPVSPVINNSLSTIVNGVNINYDIISTTTESYTVDGEQFTDLIVNASKTGSPTESVTFRSAYLQPGTNSMIYFEINNGELEYDTGNENSFAMTINESTAHNLKGVFSGTVKNWDLTESAVITNGTFDIKM